MCQSRENHYSDTLKRVLLNYEILLVGLAGFEPAKPSEDDTCIIHASRFVQTTPEDVSPLPEDTVSPLEQPKVRYDKKTGDRSP